MSDKKRIWLKLLWILGGLALVLMLGVYVAHISSKSGLEKYRAQLAAAGEELLFEKLVPPPVPDELNSASIFQQVVNLMDAFPPNCLDKLYPPAMTMVAPGKAMVGWRQPDVRDSERTNTWEEMSSALDERAGALDLLHEMSSRPYLAFDLNYRDGMHIKLPQLAKIKASATLLNVATLIALQKNDSSAAIAHNRALYAMVNSWTNEPLLISMLVRVACGAIGLSGTWEILQAAELQDAELAALQSDLQRMNILEAAEHALVTERAYISMSAATLRASASPFSDMSIGGGSGGSGAWYDLEELWRGTRLRTKETLWRVALSYPDELRALQGCAVVIDSLRAAKTNAPFRQVLDRQEAELTALGLEKSDMDPFGDPADFDPRSIISESVSTLSKAINRVMAVEVQRQMAITAIALKRYQQRHGRYPNDLAALVPDLLVAVPIDPVDGKPLRYHLESDDSYTLYSVGENGTDEGGDPNPEPPSRSSAWQRGRDWVWPRAAAETEVEAYWNDVRSWSE